MCGVCARLLSMKEYEMRELRLLDIPHKERLRPYIANADQNVVEGMLLEVEGVKLGSDGKTVTNVCKDCYRDLQSSKEDPPRYSLANNLWIGPRPVELEIMTLPEALLVAHVYPRVFTCKLWPKDGRGANADTLQLALRGNVTSFELNVDAVGKMIQGRMMPRPLAILPHLISITFVGQRKLTKSSIKQTFRVRRQVVLNALICLKRINTRYYGDVIISDDALQALPLDDVPKELVQTILQETDETVLDYENDTYVPIDEEQEEDLTREEGGPENTEDQEGELNACKQPQVDISIASNVIPLQYLGQQDVELDRISANDLLAVGLSNLWEPGLEGAYAVKHGNRPVSTFGYNPNSSYDTPANNYWERAFPTLYPYGMGGPEIPRPVTLSLTDHIRWSLRYFDKRFRIHQHFPFTAFSILQRREALLSARIQMNRADFQRDAPLLQEVNLEMMKRAADREAKGQPILDLPAKRLMKHIHGTASKVSGSDASRYSCRSKMWNQAYFMNPPNLWMTINPDDIDHPIVQFLVGEDIDLDEFEPLCGPDKTKRASNTAEDPFAAAEYFNFIIKAVLQALLGICSQNGYIISERGILGPISGYFGVVETQGRGTLHLHMLLWMVGSPSGGEFSDLLKSETFRERLKTYIQTNIHAFGPGTESEESVRATAKTPNIAWRSIPKPEQTEEYRREMEKLEYAVGRTKQIHVCKARVCEVQRPNGTVGCKRKAPWQLAPETHVEADGSWGPKRSYGYVNPWNPVIATHLRCNHDLKILTNGTESCKLTFYCTCYASKKLKRSYNVSALIAKRYAFDQSRDAESEGLQNAGRKMLIRCLETIRKEQEIAAPLVMSFLMGWGDVYCSHRFETVYWTSFVTLLLETFPALKNQKHSYDIISPQIRVR